MEKQQLPKWKCFKEVEAFKIEDIRFHTNEETLLKGDNHSVIVSARYMAKHEPSRGGYYVRYADGYESYSPAQAFEEGYAPMIRGDEIPGFEKLVPGKIMVIPPPPETAFIKWATELYQLWYKLHGVGEVQP